MDTKLTQQLKTLNVITSNGNFNKQSKKLLSKHPDCLQQVIDVTSFLHSEATLIERLFCVKNNITEQPTCLVCKESTTYNKAKKLFNKFCPNKKGKVSCAGLHEETQNSRKQTLIDKYGCDNPSKNKSIREKTSNTNIKKYGGVAPMCDVTVRQRAIKTNRKRYGCDNPSQNELVCQKRENTNIKKYNARTYAQSLKHPDVLARINTLSYDTEWLTTEHHTHKRTITNIGVELGLTTSALAKRFNDLNIDIVKHSHPTCVSSEEIYMREFIKSLVPASVKMEYNTTDIITPKELDIYIPRYNIAFEYCGVYWHSELHNRGKNYHKNKNSQCTDVGVRLYQIWSSEWLYKKDIVKSRIRSIMQRNSVIYARNCTIVELPTNGDVEFLNNTHIQGHCRSSIRLGLENETGELVAVMTLGHSRFQNLPSQFELLRYSNALNTNVVGGASKLLNYFKHTHKPQHIISYSDRRWNNGKLYKELEFNHTHTSSPNYHYFDTNGNTNELHSRQKFQKHKLDKKLENFNADLTEWQNMVAHGYDRIWDCGNDVFVWSA